MRKIELVNELLLPWGSSTGPSRRYWPVRRTQGRLELDPVDPRELEEARCCRGPSRRLEELGGGVMGEEIERKRGP